MISPLTRGFPMTQSCGLPSCMRAAGFGLAASTTQKQSSTPCPANKEHKSESTLQHELPEHGFANYPLKRQPRGELNLPVQIELHARELAESSRVVKVGSRIGELRCV